ncbi:MAG: alanine--tRNA ligase [Candidatus Staskawiczbacteria bacterium]|nr:alanine--tRNA ligase [Candidatus Staskawiczbacteria bacterium]
MDSNQLRQKFLEFFEKNGHTIVPSSSLLPTDSSVLFTTAGMQQFKPYYLGEESPFGKNVASCQKCIRTSDIEEVGDESHLTFFEMLGNFSFGGYFKEEAIKLAHKFIVEELGLKIDYVTIFSGDSEVQRDDISKNVWFNLGIKDIRECGREDNFWGPTGDEGPCGPTTEIYVDGVEIWNIVFNEFFCTKDKKLEKLKTPGVDTGMGLERLAMVVQGKKSVFETDLFEDIFKQIPEEMIYTEKEKRIIADHARAISFLISDGVRPSNKDQGYVLRRLIRRITGSWSQDIFKAVVDKYQITYSELNLEKIWDVIDKEAKTFMTALKEGVVYLNKIKNPTTKDAFYVYQTHGLPISWIKKNIPSFDEKEFEEELKKHQELSRTASAGMFKGGLADHKLETIKLHTAHHLLLAALQQVFGKTVKQKGSNITSERLRIDFSFGRKLTDEEKKKVEDIVNEKIKKGFSIVNKEMLKEEARKIGAEMEFGVKYGNTVSVYFIKDKKGNVFSKEFCGGPHVKNTSELGKFKIIKEEALGSGVRRIKAILE